MRISLPLVLAVAIASALFVAARDDSSSADDGAVTLVGDSLNVGTEPYLREKLRGWTIDAHDQVGRSTVEGVDELRRLAGTLAPIVVVSLGTNDADGTESEFREFVEQAVEIVGPARCLVWATIVRNGLDRTPFNLVLRDARSAHSNVRLVDWAQMVSDDDSLLASDGVHGTPNGYERRAAETAAVARACPR